MVDRIEGLVKKYHPEMLSKLQEKAKAVEKAVSAKVEQTAQVTRATVTYTKAAVVTEAKKELHEIFTGMLKRELSPKEQESVAKLAEGLVKEILS
jgi:hypothetical protein